ncbi:MAG: hypothetical protein ACQESR_09125 [Planctomycetota bacterium]
MSETTVQSFVEKLRNEGVEVGQREADRLRAEAEQEKQEILAKARAEADNIKSNAQAEADSILEKSKHELELAARDAALTLKDSLERALQAIIAKPVQEELSRPEFLQQVIKEVVSKYAEADIAGQTTVSINLSPDLAKKMEQWAINELGRACGGGGEVDVKGTLKEAGFEYTFSGGTVEVTAASIVETFGGMLSQKLRDTLTRAMQSEN